RPGLRRISKSSRSTSTRASSAGTAGSTCRSSATPARSWSSSPPRRARGSLDAEKAAEMTKLMATDQVPIHPLRLCKEVRDFLRRDAILVVDGQEILNYGRQSIPTFAPGHRLNSGPFGCMGVGLPFGIGAKVAHPDAQVVVLHGDGSYGINAMEIDTAVRHRIPVVVVISNNGGWTADPQGSKPGRNLGYTRYDKVAQDLGAHGEFVEKPHEILRDLVVAR